MLGKIFSLTVAIIVSFMLITCYAAQTKNSSSIIPVRNKLYAKQKPTNRQLTGNNFSSRFTIRYQDTILKKFRKKDSNTLMKYLGKTYKKDRHYAAKVLGERDADSDKAVMALAVMLSDRDIKARISAFDALVEIDEKELAEAISQSYNSNDPETRFNGIKEIKDKRFTKIFLKSFRKNVRNGAPLEALNYMISSDEIDISDRERKKITNEIISLSVKSFSRASEKAQKTIVKIIANSDKNSFMKVMKRYNTYPEQVMQIIKILYETDKQKTENAIVNSLNSLKTTYRSKPAKFISGFADNTLANRIIDYVLKNGSMDQKTAIEFLAVWPVKRAKDKLKDIISKRNRDSLHAVAAAGRIGDPSFTPYILDYLAHSRRYNKEKAVETLGFLMDKRAVKPLCKLLKKKNNLGIKNKIITSLGYIQDPSAIPCMLKHNPGGKSTVSALFMNSSPKSIPFLLKKISSSKRYSYRSNNPLITDALIMCGKNSIPYMKNILANPKSGLNKKTVAIRVIGVTGTKRDARSLLPFLKSGNSKLRKETAYALGRIGYIPAIPLILKNKKRNDYYTVKSLVMMGKPAMVYLKKYADNKKSPYRDTAIEVLGKIYNAYAAYKSGQTYMKLNDFSNASRRFSKAISIKPNFHKARINMGFCNYKLKSYRNAVINFKNVAINAPGLRARAFMNLGAAYQKGADSPKNKQKDYPMLARIYTAKALKLKSSLASANYNMGWLYDQTFTLDSASKYNEMALKQKPSHIKAKILKASILAKKGKTGLSESILEKAADEKGCTPDLQKTIEKDIELIKGKSI